QPRWNVRLPQFPSLIGETFDNVTMFRTDGHKTGADAMPAVGRLQRPPHLDISRKWRPADVQAKTPARSHLDGPTRLEQYSGNADVEPLDGDGQRQDRLVTCFHRISWGPPTLFHQASSLAGSESGLQISQN